MKTKIKLAIDNIKNQIDYIENNSDFLDNYYEIVPDFFTYYDNEIKQKIFKLIEEKTDIELSKVDKHFVSDVIYDIATNDYYFNLKRNYDIYGGLCEYDLFGIDAGEQEIQIFEMCEYTLTEWQKNYIGYKTDTVINSSFDTYYAYIELFYSITVSLNIDDCIELINDKYEDIILSS